MVFRARLVSQNDFTITKILRVVGYGLIAYDNASFRLAKLILRGDEVDASIQSATYVANISFYLSAVFIESLPPDILREVWPSSVTMVRFKLG